MNWVGRGEIDEFKEKQINKLKNPRSCHITVLKTLADCQKVFWQKIAKFRGANFRMRKGS